MLRPTARGVGEAIAVLGVVLSLMFVGLQLRQGAVVSRASAYQELGIAMSEGWRLRASDRELNDLLDRAGSSDPAVWASLTESDLSLVRAFALSVLRIYQSAYLEVQEGLLGPEALEDLGLSGFRQSNLARNMWPQLRGYLSPGFAAYFASELDLPQG